MRAVGGRRSQEFIILPALPPPSSHLYTPCCITMYYIIHTPAIHTHTNNTGLEISYTLYYIIHTRNTHTHTQIIRVSRSHIHCLLHLQTSVTHWISSIHPQANVACKNTKRASQKYNRAPQSRICIQLRNFV